MADLTLEILRNKDKYPDDRKIVLGDGDEITVKELRDRLQPRADFTDASEKWKRRETELQTEVQRNSEAVQGLQAQLAEALKQTAPATQAPGTLTQEDLLADPVLGPLYKDLQEARAELKGHNDRLKMHEDYVLRKEYTGKLSDLSQRYNTRFNKDGKGKAFDQKRFLDYVLQNQVTNLDIAYDAYTLQDEVTASAAEAEERGVERGKATAVPHVPFGRRHAPVKPEGLPADFQSVTEETLLADPEIQEAMQKDLAG